MSHLGFPLEKSKATVTVTIQTTIPHRFLGGKGHGNPLMAPKLQHTWGNHHEQRGEAMEMEKTEIGEEILPVFGGEQQRRTAACPNLPHLLFSSLSLPLPSLFLIWSRQGLAA